MWLCGTVDPGLYALDKALGRFPEWPRCSPVSGAGKGPSHAPGHWCRCVALLGPSLLFLCAGNVCVFLDEGLFSPFPVLRLRCFLAALWEFFMFICRWLN